MTGPTDAGSTSGSVRPRIAILLTQIATAEALAAACAVHKAQVDAVTSPIGAYAVCREPEGAAGVAQAVSSIARSVPLILVEAQDGQISAGQWVDGQRVGDLAPGLVLDGAPHEFEDLLLGAVSVRDLDGVVSSVGMSRWKAMRALAGTARAARGRR